MKFSSRRSPDWRAFLLACLGTTACSQYEMVPTNDASATEVDTGRVPGDTEDVPPEEGELHTDNYVVEGSTKVDIIVFADTSGSMQIELSTLGGKIQEFLDYLDVSSADWQIASINAPDGCAVSGIITPDTPSYAQVFANGIVQVPSAAILAKYGGDAAEPDEQGLNSLATAAENALGGCNDGLVRNGALLHAIVISDEDDVSPGFGTNNYWQQYVDRLAATKAGLYPGPMKISAIAGPVPNGCSDADTDAEPGLGYDEAVPATGGEFVSICDNWPTHIEDLAAASISQDRFQLAYEPVPGSIEVSVNMDPRSGGWIYDGADNAVVFTQDVPGVSDTVQILYQVAGS